MVLYINGNSLNINTDARELCSQECIALIALTNV